MWAWRQQESLIHQTQGAHFFLFFSFAFDKFKIISFPGEESFVCSEIKIGDVGRGRLGGPASPLLLPILAKFTSESNSHIRVRESVLSKMPVRQLSTRNHFSHETVSRAVFASKN